jgi:hypothetical protein
LIAEAIAAAVLRRDGAVKLRLDLKGVHGLVQLGVEGLGQSVYRFRARLRKHVLEAADGAAQAVEERLLRAARLGRLDRAPEVVYDRQER